MMLRYGRAIGMFFGCLSPNTQELQKRYEDAISAVAIAFPTPAYVDQLTVEGATASWLI
jgi:hypothetical protein